MYERDLPFSVVRKCPAKLQNRERGTEFCRSRKIIKLLFSQGQVRLRHFLGRARGLGKARGLSAAATGQVKLLHVLGRALRLGQARGLNAAPTCLTFKTPPAASLYAGIPQILFFWIYKIQPPSLRPETPRGTRAQLNMANDNIKLVFPRHFILNMLRIRHY